MSETLFFVVIVILVLFIGFSLLYVKLTAVKESFSELKNATAPQIPVLKEKLESIADAIADSRERSVETAEYLGKIAVQWGNMKDVIEKINHIFSDTVKKGKIGEFLLEQILSSSLPDFLWARQYTIDGREQVDAVIFLKRQELILPIDSKFPADKAMAGLNREGKEKKSAWAEFRKVILKNASEIADKYIRPQKGTTDYAVMFVPSEDILSLIASPLTPFGETNDILPQLQQKKVIVASPSTIFAFISLALAGHQSLAIEERALEFVKIAQDALKRLEEMYRLAKEIQKKSQEINNKAETLARKVVFQKKKLTNLTSKEESLDSESEDDILI